jgi:hypothetical protein
MRTYNDYCENRRIVASTSYAHTLAVIQVEQLNLQLENYNNHKAHHQRLHEIDPEIYTKEPVESYDDQIKFQELVLKQKKADLELARHNYLKSERDCKTVYDEFQLSNKEMSEKYKKDEEAVKKAKEEWLKKKEEAKEEWLKKKEEEKETPEPAPEQKRVTFQIMSKELMTKENLELANKVLREAGMPSLEEVQASVQDLFDKMTAAGHPEQSQLQNQIQQLQTQLEQPQRRMRRRVKK